MGEVTALSSARAVAAVAAQLTQGTRPAVGTAAAVLGASFLLWAVGDIGPTVLSWLSPVGWAMRMRPFAEEQWRVLRLAAALIAVLTGVTYRLLGRLAALLGGARIEPISVPDDCIDGFGAAYWRRPRAYVDPVVRAGVSMLAQTGDDALRPGLDRLAADLTSGRWHRQHRDLPRRDEFDAGYRLIIAER